MPEPPSSDTAPPAPTPSQTFEIDDEPVQLAWRLQQLLRQLSAYLRDKASPFTSSSVRSLINNLAKKIHRKFSITEKLLTFLIGLITLGLFIDSWRDSKRSSEISEQSLALSEWTALKDWHAVCKESDYNQKGCQDIQHTPLSPPPSVSLTKRMVSIYQEAKRQTTPDTDNWITIVILGLLITYILIESLTSSPLSRILPCLPRSGSLFLPSSYLYTKASRHIIVFFVLPVSFGISFVLGLVSGVIAFRQVRPEIQLYRLPY